MVWIEAVFYDNHLSRCYSFNHKRGLAHFSSKILKAKQAWQRLELL